MIEKYFMLGVRMKWACPGEDASLPKDGSLFDNPAVKPPPLIYDGMDGELYNLAASHKSTAGLTMRMNVPYSWLVYAHGRTTRLVIPASDVLTGPMSGCLIAKWTDRGNRYVGHVGTVTDRDDVNRLVKSTFVGYMPPDTTGFLPAKAWDIDRDIIPKQLKFKTTVARPKVMALITQAGDFYSILMFEFSGKSGTSGEWCIGGIKKMPAMDCAEIRTELTKVAPVAATSVSG